MENIKDIGIEKDGDILFVTVAKYKLFMSYGKIGIDAYCVYTHLMFTARLQGTNQVYANDVYLRQGLGWSREKLSKAKQLLIELGLVEEISKRDEQGQFTGKYIKVITSTTPFEIKSIEYPDDGNPADGNTADGKTATNALTNNIKCFNEKENAYREIYGKLFNFWNDRANTQKHKDITTFTNNFKKTKLKQILKEYTPDDIEQAINNYDIILGDEKYYFKYKWTLWEFLSRGLSKFVFAAAPFTNFVNKNNIDASRDDLYKEKYDIRY